VDTGESELELSKLRISDRKPTWRFASSSDIRFSGCCVWLKQQILFH